MASLIYSVEDDVNIAHVIQIAMQNSGFDIQGFSDGKSFFQAMDVNHPDLILLDIMLPDLDGIEILKRLKGISNYKNIPVMIISAKSTELDKVIGLDSGADDYMQKPFGVLELISRVKSLLRRTIKSDDSNVIEIGELKLDVNEHILTFNNEIITLTIKEFQLIKLLMQNPNKTMTREDIFSSVWGYDFLGETRTLDVHIKEVRQKLTKAGANPDIIQTIRGVGYKFVI
ncbi:MAG: DNA-binding response regulator [Tenericutes bacterium HGW-Tenericutes-1]|jgi:two-component system alkaline phosphatase synthesis response regulator PhoP|nr:MAG: DNA-binding response regulator [Tenericutes bacterium HGW-Tenericutes-1]